jgi:hypothetical protein
VFLSWCPCEVIGSRPSLLRCWRCAPGTSCSQGARQVPLKRTVFRHTKLSKSFRESFELAGKLLDTAERLIGDLDPKVPIDQPFDRTGPRWPGRSPSAWLRSPASARHRGCKYSFGRGNGPSAERLVHRDGPNARHVRGAFTSTRRATQGRTEAWDYLPTVHAYVVIRRGCRSQGKWGCFAPASCDFASMERRMARVPRQTDQSDSATTRALEVIRQSRL